MSMRKYSPPGLVLSPDHCISFFNSLLLLSYDIPYESPGFGAPKPIPGYSSLKFFGFTIQSK